MDIFGRQQQLTSLFQTNPVDAAYALGMTAGKKMVGKYSDLDIALLLLEQISAKEFFDYQVYFVSELSKTLEINDIEVLILNQASLLQRAQVVRNYGLLYQRDQKRRVVFEARAVMEYLEFQKYDEMQSRALQERTRGERFAVDTEYVRARLGRMREYVRLLQDLQPIDHDKFRADPKLYGLAQWYLQQAVELLFGTGAYLVMALALPKPEAHHDILDALAGRDVIEKTLAYRLEALATMRNLLAYDREQTNIGEVYDLIQGRLGDLAAFADSVERFIGERLA